MTDLMSNYTLQVGGASVYFSVCQHKMTKYGRLGVAYEVVNKTLSIVQVLKMFIMGTYTLLYLEDYVNS